MSYNDLYDLIADIELEEKYLTMKPKMNLMVDGLTRLKKHTNLSKNMRVVYERTKSNLWPSSSTRC